MDNQVLSGSRQHESFNMFYFGEKLSLLERACIKSFVAHGHEVRVFTYDEVELPDGAVMEDARQILPLNDLFIFENSPSGFSNIFRYKLLLERGGWWVDTDVVCLSRQIPACDYFWAEQAPGEINGALLKFPAGDAKLAHILEQSIQRARHLQIWGQLGPRLLTEMLKDYHPKGHLGGKSLAYPVHNLEVHAFWLPEFAETVEKRSQASVFLHLWHAMFERMGIDLKCPPPIGSYLSKLYENYDESITGQAQDELLTRQSIIRFLINSGRIKTILPELASDSNPDVRIENYYNSIKSLVAVISEQEDKINSLETQVLKMDPNPVHWLARQLRSWKGKVFPPGSRGAYWISRIAHGIFR